MSGETSVVVYLGGVCNQDCGYCDRYYIKEVGSQTALRKDVPEMVAFIKKNLDKLDAKNICFHGGEPFLFVSMIDAVLEELNDPEIKISILTNGTLLDKKYSKEFLKKYGERLEVSISYDFLQQEKNRGYSIDIFDALSILTNAGVKITQLQWVIDPRDKEAFALDTVQFIASIYKKYKIGMITLIPMRHTRGRNFEIILDQIDIKGFFQGFLQFMQLLYVLGVRVTVDGNDGRPSKKYFDNHKQLILSPDGYMYPEFDFLEYKMDDARIGNWRENKIDRKVDKDHVLTHNSCHKCPSFNSCGIKYLYKEFNKIPSGNCNTFYQYLNTMIKHSLDLSKYRNLIEVFK